jgi:hypothetical protein
MENKSYNTISGAKALIEIDNKIAGFATGISITETTLNGRVDSLGFFDTREVTPIGRAVGATINFLRIFTPPGGFDENSVFKAIGATETDEGAIVNTPDTEGQTDSTRTDNALLRRPFTLTIYDTAPGQAEDVPMYKLHGCRIASQNIVVDRGSLMGVQCTIDAVHLERLDGQPAVV